MPLRPITTIRPSVNVTCSRIWCGSLSHPEAWSLGTTNRRQVSASLAIACVGYFGHTSNTFLAAQSPILSSLLRPSPFPNVLAPLRDGAPMNGSGHHSHRCRPVDEQLVGPVI